MILNLITVISASLGFVLSLALNDAFKLSFDAMLKKNVSRRALESNWIYALCCLLFVFALLYILNGCVAPALSKTTLACTHPWSWLFPTILLSVMIVVIILASTLSEKEEI